MSSLPERREFRVFEDWLQSYGQAWEAKDADAFSAQFADQCRYLWSPFADVLEGRDAVASAFREAVENQHGIKFRYTVIDWADHSGTAHWRCEFARKGGKEVIVDGILRAFLDEDSLCEEFHEWWHSNEGHDGAS